MQNNIINLAHRQPGGGDPPKYDPLRSISPREAARRTGISYEHMLALFKVHGRRIGRLYYMTERNLSHLLDGKET